MDLNSNEVAFYQPQKRNGSACVNNGEEDSRLGNGPARAGVRDKLKEERSMKNKSILFAAVGLMALLLLGTISASAQTSTTGSIEGTVTDSTGASAPNARVTVSWANLSSPQTATSDRSGTFRFSDLPAGKYTVKVEASNGSESFERKNVNVRPGQTTSLKIKLRRRD